MNGSEEVERLRARVAELEADVAEFEGREDEAQGPWDALKSQCNELREKVEQLTKERDAARAEADTTKGVLERAEADCAKWTKWCLEQDKAIGRIKRAVGFTPPCGTRNPRRDVAEIVRRVERLARCPEKIRNLRRAIKGQEIARGRAKREAEIQRKIAIIFEKFYSEWKQRAEASERAARNACQLAEIRESARDGLRQDVNALRAKLAAAEQRAEAAEKDLADGNRRREAAEKQADVLADNVLALDAERERLRAAGKASEAKVRELVAETEQLAKDRFAVAQKLDRLRAAGQAVFDAQGWRQAAGTYGLWDDFLDALRAAAADDAPTGPSDENEENDGK